MATVFVGGSALLIAGAIAALAFGFADGEETLVWTSLVACAGSAVFLVVAYVISLRDLKAGRRKAAAATASTSTSSTSTDGPYATAPVEAVSTQQQSEVQSVASDAGQNRTPASDAGDTGTESEAVQDGDEPETAEEGAQTDSAAPSTGTMAAGSPTTPKPSTAKKSSAPGTAAAAKPSSPSDQVVAVASKKRFHRPDCRYAKTEGAEDTTRAAARRRGYTPCGICKP